MRFEVISGLPAPAFDLQDIPFDSCEAAQQAFDAESIRLATLPEYALLLAMQLQGKVSPTTALSGGPAREVIQELEAGAERVARIVSDQNAVPHEADRNFLARFLGLSPDVSRNRIIRQYNQRKTYMDTLHFADSRQLNLAEAIAHLEMGGSIDNTQQQLEEAVAKILSEHGADFPRGFPGPGVLYYLRSQVRRGHNPEFSA